MINPNRFRPGARFFLRKSGLRSTARPTPWGSVISPAHLGWIGCCHRLHVAAGMGKSAFTLEEVLDGYGNQSVGISHDQPTYVVQRQGSAGKCGIVRELLCTGNAPRKTKIGMDHVHGSVVEEVAEAAHQFHLRPSANGDWWSGAVPSSLLGKPDSEDLQSTKGSCIYGLGHADSAGVSSSCDSARLHRYRRRRPHAHSHSRLARRAVARW